jgi:hypothetical protein
MNKRKVDDRSLQQSAHEGGVDAAEHEQQPVDPDVARVHRCERIHSIGFSSSIGRFLLLLLWECLLFHGYPFLIYAAMLASILHGSGLVLFAAPSAFLGLWITPVGDLMCVVLYLISADPRP